MIQGSPKARRTTYWRGILSRRTPKSYRRLEDRSRLAGEWFAPNQTWETAMEKPIARRRTVAKERNLHGA